MIFKLLVKFLKYLKISMDRSLKWIISNKYLKYLLLKTIWV